MSTKCYNVDMKGKKTTIRVPELAEKRQFVVSLRLSPVELEKLDRLAEKERRTRANMLYLLVERALEAAK